MKLFDIMRFMSDYGLDISRADTFIGAKKSKTRNRDNDGGRR